LETYVASADLVGDLPGDTLYAENMNILNTYMVSFMERHDAYRKGITRLGSTLGQVQAANTSFTLTVPSFYPITVSIYQRLLINSLHTDFVFDPHIFTIQEISGVFLYILASFAGDGNITALIKSINLAHPRSIGRFDRSLLNRLVNPHVNLSALDG
jgi:hypothetical protein